MPISENIKKLRDRFGITQKELAAIADVTDKAVSTWELGTNEPRMGAIQRMADHFGIQKSNLIEDGGMVQIFGKPTTVSDDGLSELLQEPYVADILDALDKLTPERRKVALVQLQALVDLEEKKDK